MNTSTEPLEEQNQLRGFREALARMGGIVTLANAEVIAKGLRVPVETVWDYYWELRRDQPKLNDELREWISESAREICEELLPLGEERNGEWVCANIDGDPPRDEHHGSLKVNLTNGVWADFGGAEDEKGDLINLWMKVRRIGFREAVTQIKAFLKDETSADRRQLNRIERKERRRQDREADRLDKECFDSYLGHGSYDTWAKWRGYRWEFVRWLVKNRHIGYYRASPAIPRRDESGRFESLQFYNQYGGNHDDYLNPDKPRKPEFYPPKSPTRPYVVGNYQTAEMIIIGESQWDVLAIGDCIRMEEDDDVCLVSTFGAQGTKLVPTDLSPKADIYVLVQNDAAGKGWTEKTLEHINRKVHVITPPTESARTRATGALRSLRT